MGYTWEDAEREEAYDRMVEEVLEEHRDFIIDQFVEERLAAFYRENLAVSEHAESALKEAVAALNFSPSAAVVFAYSCIELTLRDLLLKPVVHGLTHDEGMGDLLADLINLRSRQTEILLFAILGTTGLPDLKSVKRAGKTVSAWEEKTTLQRLRNQILHLGKAALSDQAAEAIALADFVLNDLFPKVRAHFIRNRR